MKHDDKTARAGVESDASWMITASGAKLFFLSPQTDVINIADIAHHLGNICRFTGAVNQYYSVAQHSVFVGQLVKKMLDDEVSIDSKSVEYWDQILAALLHDSEEAYVQDLSSPLKSCVRGKYTWIATGIRRKVFEKFFIDWEYYNKTVKAADNTAISVERYYLMPDHPDWPKTSKFEMRYPRPQPMDPQVSTKLFSRVLQYAFNMRHACRSGGDGR